MPTGQFLEVNICAAPHRNVEILNCFLKLFTEVARIKLCLKFNSSLYFCYFIYCRYKINSKINAKTWKVFLKYISSGYFIDVGYTEIILFELSESLCDNALFRI